ncbi:MAG: CehA/McbA family metallohydrolase [Bacillota bacterium]
MQVLRGNLHVHSLQSDGTLSLPEIAAIAAQTGLDFVGINDHHVICGESLYVQDVLFLMGTEFNSTHNHYLAYNTPVSYPERQVEAAALVEAVKKSGGMGIIAHPFEKGSKIVSGGKRYPWLDWDVQDYDAMELWNLTSQWRDAATTYIGALFLWLFWRHHPFFRGACPRALAKWDELCQIRHVTGLAGSDLHGPIIKALCLKFKVLDYPMLFAAVNNYVPVAEVTGAAEQDAGQLLAALSRGNCWFALDHLGLAHGFSFSATAGEEEAGMGEFLAPGGARNWLHVRSPQPGRLRVVRDGKPWLQRDIKKNLALAVEAGVYRVEIWARRGRRYLPWLYSNPIYIKKESS